MISAHTTNTQLKVMSMSLTNVQVEYCFSPLLYSFEKYERGVWECHKSSLLHQPFSLCPCKENKKNHPQTHFSHWLTVCCKPDCSRFDYCTCWLCYDSKAIFKEKNFRRQNDSLNLMVCACGAGISELGFCLCLRISGLTLCLDAHQTYGTRPGMENICGWKR